MRWGLSGLGFAGFGVILGFSWFRFGFMAPYLEVRYTSRENPLTKFLTQLYAAWPLLITRYIVGFYVQLLPRQGLAGLSG